MRPAGVASGFKDTPRGLGCRRMELDSTGRKPDVGIRSRDPETAISMKPSSQLQVN